MNGKFPSDKCKPKPVFLHDLSSLGLDFFGAVLIYTSIPRLRCSWRGDSLAEASRTNELQRTSSQRPTSVSLHPELVSVSPAGKAGWQLRFLYARCGGGWLQSWGDISYTTSVVVLIFYYFFICLIKTKASSQFWNLPWWLPQVTNTTLKPNISKIFQILLTVASVY